LPRAKVKAGGMLRSAIDTTWQTPEWLLDRVRLLFPGGQIPFDPASTSENPTKALRYCAGVPGTLYAGTGAKCVGCRTGPPRCEGCGAIEHSGNALCGPCGLKASDLALGLSLERWTCPECCLAQRNGLEVDWDWPFFVNPPFTTEWITKIGVQVRRRFHAGNDRVNGVAVLPCNRFEEPFLQDVLVEASAVCFVDAKAYQAGLSRPHRVAFISSADGQPVDKNPFATMLLGFGFDPQVFAAAFSSHPEPSIGSTFALRPIGRRT
jgi:hypothetical protein